LLRIKYLAWRFQCRLPVVLFGLIEIERHELALAVQLWSCMALQQSDMDLYYNVHSEAAGFSFHFNAVDA
jgi:hypothetical protein